jgi:hypothetical protein
MKTCFFDLETEYLIQDLDPETPSLSFKEKQSRRGKIVPRLNMAIACVLDNDEGSTIRYFEKGQEAELIRALKEFDRIIGHNLFDFDYLVLSPHFNGNDRQELQAKTYDTFTVLREASGGTWLGLDELCQLNFGTKKNLDTMDVPRLWRSGEKEKVREYCYNDVLMLKQLFLHGKAKGVLKYHVKSYGKPVGIRELRVPWVTMDI